MHKNTHHKIRKIMHTYVANGKKSTNKINQMTRLIKILDDIFKHENTENLNTLGRNQIIGYWSRNTDAYSTRYNKYLILREFFARANPAVTVPKPKNKKITL